MTPKAVVENKMPPPPTGTIIECEKEYHAKSKSGEYMSSGMLKKFREGPIVYHCAITGQFAEKTPDAFRFGRAVHKICLEGESAFNKEFAIGGPINPGTGKPYGVSTKAYDEWLAAAGKTRDQVLNDTEADAMFEMAATVGKHPLVAAFLEYGWPELVVRAPLCDVPCQIRMDWLTHDSDESFTIIDLKTTDSISWFESDAKKYGYLHQFAFYRDVFQTTGREAGVAVIVAEKKPPYRVGLWNIPTEVLDLYSMENRTYLELFKYCKKHDEWPTGYEAMREFGLPLDKIGA